MEPTRSALLLLPNTGMERTHSSGMEPFHSMTVGSPTKHIRGIRASSLLNTRTVPRFSLDLPDPPGSQGLRRRPPSPPPHPVWLVRPCVILPRRRQVSSPLPPSLCLLLSSPPSLPSVSLFFLMMAGNDLYANFMAASEIFGCLFCMAYKLYD